MESKNFWWVNHNKRHKDELSGGYIWSPKENSNGSINQTYLNLTKIKEKDIIFSYAQSVVKAIGIASGIYQNSERPKAEANDKEGWLVKIDWIILENSFSPKSFIQQIVPLLPKKHSPIQQNGNGNQCCYLAAIDNELGNLIIDLSKINKDTLL